MRWVAVALGLVVLVPAILITFLHRFDGLYGQDSFAYVDYALGPLTEALLAFQPLPDFHWPPGFPLLVALVALATGLGAASGQVVSLLAGAAIPILVALLAGELIPAHETARSRWAVPILAGLVVGLAGQLWQSSVVAMSDTTGIAAATLGAWSVCRYARTGSLLWLALAAVSTGVAIEVRLICALVSVPLAFVAAHKVAETWQHARRRASGHAVVGLLMVTVFATPALVALAAASASQSWSPAFALQSTVETLDGRFSYSLPTGAFYLLQPAEGYWFSALSLLALPGMARVVRRGDAVQVAVLLAWPALLLAFLAGNPYQNTRYFLAAAPPVAILVGLGALETYRFTERLAGAQRLAMGPALAFALVMALAVNALEANRFTVAFVERVSAEAASIRSLAAHVPAGARLITLGATALLNHDRTPNVVELAALDAQETEQLLTEGVETFVLIDRAAIASQWQTRAPGLAIASLEAAPGVRWIADAGMWTLYEVAPI